MVENHVFLLPIFMLATQERLNGFAQSVLLKGVSVLKMYHMGLNRRSYRTLCLGGGGSECIKIS